MNAARAAWACAIVACAGSEPVPVPVPSPSPSPSLSLSPSPAPSRPPSPSPPPPLVLAASPRIDLDANRPRWHVYDRGLVIPFGGSGLAKYEQRGRGTAFTPVRKIDGHAGRLLKTRATLRFPWLAEDGADAGEILVRARGPGTLTLSLDGKRLGAARIARGWNAARIAIPAGRMTPGEHALQIDGAHAIVIARMEITAGTAPEAACTDGWRRVSLYGELPATAHLVAHPTGASRIRIRLTDETNTSHLVYDGDAASLPAPLALPDTADRVVRLDLESTIGCARWDGAQIAIVAATTPPAPRPPPVDNAILIVVDTLRSDRLAAYNDTRVATPWITAAAARGAVFLRNQSMAPASPPSHATIQSGVYPRVHGAMGESTPLAKGSPLLSAILVQAGFFAGYVGNNDYAMSRQRAPGRWKVFETPYYAHGKDCAPIVARAVALATREAAAGHRFFLSLLPIEPHAAYRFHPGVTDRYYGGPYTLGKTVVAHQLVLLRKRGGQDLPEWQQVRALYDGEVSHADECLAALGDGLAAAGLLDRTAIVITSDHGEGMGERPGAAGHAYSLHRELVDVPLIIAGGVPAVRVGAVSSNADIAPTILDLLGLPADARMQGRSLLPDMLGASLPRIAASEYGTSYALRAGHWHLFDDYDQIDQLYDVTADPDETRERSADAAIPLRYLRDAAGMFLAYRRVWHEASWGSLGDLAPGNPLADDAFDD